jgi:hypothetical protein
VLELETAGKLSVQTPSWGQFQPIIMPEGIGSRSGVLQETVRKIFEDFEDWCILCSIIHLSLQLTSISEVGYIH